jgi:hypothetical protein
VFVAYSFLDEFLFYLLLFISADIFIAVPAEAVSVEPTALSWLLHDGMLF